MARIFVSPLAHVSATVRLSGAQNVLALVEADNLLPELTAAGVRHHTTVRFSDIIEPREGYILAEPEHVSRIIEFISAWDRDTALLIHCFAGISRSTAAAYIAACALMPDRNEERIAAELREASPSATPNIHLVGLADGILGRNGRMTGAIRAIGRGADAFEGEVFSLEVPDNESRST